MVKRVGESRVYQLDVPAQAPARSLAALVASNLGWDRDPEAASVGYDVEVFPPGRMLRLDESLADARCPDGTWMVLHPRSAEPAEDPGYVWRRLDTEEVDDVPDPPTYVWKQLDTEDDDEKADHERLDKQCGGLSGWEVVAGGQSPEALGHVRESRNVLHTASR